MAKAIENFHNTVRKIDPVWIDMPDGCRLAMTIWMPEASEDTPVPAMLEYIPYRRRDGTAQRDARHHPYLAGHGIACVRPDMRGSGDSDGVMDDEYLKLEQDDALAIIEWIAAQPWCNGSVAMMGISWGGFSSLQAAHRAPPALKAIVPVAFTHDRFAVDIHYKGGALLGGNFDWAATMLSYNSRPPDPEIRPDDWKEVWLSRLNQQPHLLEPWLEHQSRDEYWAHGSVCEDYSQIKTPILAAAGWLDCYSEAIMPLHNGVDVPVRSLIGPWAHKYPHLEIPRPGVGFLGDIVAWCGRWLKEVENGIEDSLPPFRAYVMEPFPTDGGIDVIPGRWIGCESWPPPEAEGQEMALGDFGTLGKEAGKRTVVVSSPNWVGMNSGDVFTLTDGLDQPGDQRAEDGGSVCFDTAPLPNDCTILGAPVLTTRLTSDVDRANLIARLCAVAPDGASQRITLGVLNLSCRESMSDPQPLPNGEAVDITLKLEDIAYKVPKGWRLRLALSTAYFPYIWPQPEQPTLSVSLAESRLSLPVASENLWDWTPSEAEEAPPQVLEELEAPNDTRTITEMRPSGLRLMKYTTDSGLVRDPDHGIVYGTRDDSSYSIEPNDPLSAVAESIRTQRIERDGVMLKTVTQSRLTGTADSFQVSARITAYQDDEQVFEKDFEKTIPRKSV